MSRRSRRKKGSADGLRGLLLAILGLMLIGAFVGGYWWVQHTRPVLDAETNCPLSGPSAVHAILFDRSDPITDQQAQRIRQAIDRYKHDASFGTRFDIYTFEGDTTHVLRPKLVICALGKPDAANPWIENPEEVRKSYETKFAAVLDQVVEDLLHASRQNSSPIIESLRAASITSFGRVDAGRLPLRLTMVSDMVQHTALSSHFQAEPNFAALSHNSAWPTLQPELKGAEVNILYLLRPTALRGKVSIQSRGHQVFWEQLVSGSGGRLIAVEPL
ncbi:MULTISPECIES: hypothetical protein [unclassified Bradyrhizobium]|uniref:hypothetical protein n=1 Tax=unclassified Bradyrhizobium TaxID=2631580 RepID=UPI0029160456|nr:MULTISPECIES: hypothetical protein [unclassified Bradyrhizobium]